MGNGYLLLTQRLIIDLHVKFNLKLQVNQLLLKADAFLCLLSNGFNLVLWAQEIRLTSGHDNALPVCSSASEPTRALANDNVEGYHNHLLADPALSEICVAIHRCVDRHICERMAKVRVCAVCGPCTNHLSRVKIFYRQLRLVVLLSIFRHIALHEQSQVDAVLTISTVIKIARGLRVALEHLGLVFLGQATVSPIRNNDDAVTFDFSALNNRLVYALSTVQLELKLRHEADVDVTTAQGRAYREHATVTTWHAHNADAKLGSLSLNISSIDEGNGLLSRSVEAKCFVNEWDVVINARRNDNHA